MEEQGAIVTLQRRGKNQLWRGQVTSCSQLTLGGLACLKSHKIGLEEEWVAGGGGESVGCGGGGMDMAFLSTAAALLGGNTTDTGTASSGTVKQLENTWCSAGNALRMDRFASFNPILLSPKIFFGDRPRDSAAGSLSTVSEQWQGLEQALETKPRAFPSNHHPLSLPGFWLWRAVRPSPWGALGMLITPAGAMHPLLQSWSNPLPSLCPVTTAVPQLSHCHRPIPSPGRPRGGMGQPRRRCCRLSVCTGTSRPRTTLPARNQRPACSAA